MTEPTPIVLLHGYGSSPGVWRDLQPLLDRPTIAPTYDGHRGGRSVADPTTFTVADIIKGVARDLDSAGITRAHLVGNSLGGWVALQLASRGYAESVTCLAPAGGWYPGLSFEVRLVMKFVLGHWACQRRRAAYPTTIASRTIAGTYLLRSMVDRPDLVPAATLNGLLDDLAECSIIGTHSLQQLGMNFTEPIDVDAPFLLVGPVRFWVRGRRAPRARFRALVPSADTVVIRGAGHLAMVDRPAEVAALVNERVATTDAATRLNPVVPRYRRLWKVRRGP